MYRFAGAAMRKYNKLSGLYSVIYCLTFWRLEVQDQGIGRAVLPRNALGKDLFQASLPALGSSLACGIITPVFMWCSLWLSLCPNSPLE